MLIDSMTISVGGGGTGGRHVLCMLAVSSALVLGFTLGNLAACRRRQQELHDEELRHPRNSTKGAKRKARIRKSEDNSRTKAAGLKSPSPSSGDQSRNKQLSRRTRNRSKKLAPKDLALDAFTKIAHSHIDCIGRGDFQSLCLLPRTAFIVAGRFVAHSSCRDRLVTLGQARAAAAGVDDLRILYVSCSWASAGGAQGDWASKDFETTRAFLEQHPDLAYVYVGRSCVSRASDGPERAAQLRHVPLVLLRADVVLVLPPASEHSADLDAVSEPSKRRPRYSDFNLHTRIAWSRMELAVAAVGQAKVYVAFRAEPFPESVCELNSGQVEVKEVTRQAANTLRAAAAVTVDMGRASEMHEERYSSGSAAALEATVQRGVTDSTATTVVVEAACENWLGSALNHLTALEDARTVVVAAEKSSDDSVLQSIWKMRPTPNADFTMVARESLGQEAVEGAKGLALSILLFTVLCSQPKERATYTDGFLEDAGNVRITYRPIAVVRSPYRERFGTPRQPQVTASVLHGRAEEGEIVFLKGHGYEEALQDLSGFDMIWVISHMHLNNGWNRKVRPPRLPEERKGLFSTRSPHRPNAVALSSLRVSRVDAPKGRIYVRGLDLLDGTPVLDIKPYIGYCDAFPDVKAGWLDALGTDHEVQGDFLPKFSVGATLVHTVAHSPGRAASYPVQPLEGHPVVEEDAS